MHPPTHPSNPTSARPIPGIARYIIQYCPGNHDRSESDIPSFNSFTLRFHCAGIVDVDQSFRPSIQVSSFKATRARAARAPRRREQFKNHERALRTIVALDLRSTYLGSLLSVSNNNHRLASCRVPTAWTSLIQSEVTTSTVTIAVSE